MALQAFHASYYGSNDQIHAEMDVMHNGVWSYTDVQHGDSTAPHARYLRQIGMGWGAGGFASNAQRVFYAYWEDKIGRAPKTPFWTNNEWMCIGTDAILVELIGDIRFNPLHSRGLFEFEIKPSLGNGVLSQKLPLKDFEWIYAEILKLQGWSESDAMREAKRALHAPPDEKARKAAQRKEDEWRQIEDEVLGRRNSTIESFGDW